MRVSLVVGGLLVAGLGFLIYGLEIPFAGLEGFALPVLNSALPFIVAGVVMIGFGAYVKEGGGPIRPPEGYRFCAFCSSLVRIGAERCDNCNGRQPLEGEQIRA